MHPHGHEHENDFEDEVLMIRIKKIKQASKPRSKQLQMRSKKCARAKAETERKSVKKSANPAKGVQLSVVQLDHQKKSPKQQANTNIVGFVAMIDKLNKAHKQAILGYGFSRILRVTMILYITTKKKIEIIPMDVHLTLALPIDERKVEEFYVKKPKDLEYNEVPSAWRKKCNF
ncbi:hypothetical protein Cgig2_030079 [Carnegiea gigantea]|uniref:Uncharacterized protein n=1 Tax=Carnegiea gigantea TaxID=171969 RepID=A0A9Q1Q999_9CARY|nr:hypothetical protein Cgig2_030079 [Carnegiea gigantea]